MDRTLADIAFCMTHVAGLDALVRTGAFGELSQDLAEAVLAEAARFAAEEIAPLRVIGDRQGARRDGAEVAMPDGWADLYRRWRGAGWNGLAAPEAHGGQNLPMLVSVAALELWNAGSVAFALGPTLTAGAVEALEKHGSEALKATYIEKLVSGEWMGTMNLTEPQAGSDLGALRTRAERATDGTYRIFGQKIFITFGEHDMADNIVHLVLARLPDAPAGTRGISLFLVPKFLPGPNGGIGARNDVQCAGLEEKMGIHASPTCVMLFGDAFAEAKEKGAVGWLVGEENRGLACMFTMMNNARLSIGMQGIGLADAALAKALAYAHERRQGRAASWRGEGMAPIVRHPDVRRMLVTMQALTGAARAISYCCAAAIDLSHAAPDEAARHHWSERAGLLTPVAKAFATDIGVEVTSLGVQVHGGMGYIEEAGAAQLLRDARIAPIYEGTNGIQAIDLVNRKLPLSEGEHVRGYIGELRMVVDRLRLSNRDGFGRTATALDAALIELSAATDWLLERLAAGDTEAALAGATPYLRLFALAAGGALLAKGALADNSPGRVALARFFGENLLPETEALKEQVVAGGDSLAEASALLLGA